MSIQQSYATVPAYPRLSALGYGNLLCTDFLFGPPHNRRSEISKRITQYEKGLSRICSKLVPVDLSKPPDKAPAQDVRRFAKVLYDIASNHWACNCHFTHEGILYLATHRSAENHRSKLMFDLLINRANTTPQMWQESNVCVTAAE